MSQGATEQVGTAGAPPARMLFAIFGGVAAWTVHFLGSYAVVAIGCVASWGMIAEIVVVATLALGGLAAWSTLSAWRSWRRSSGDQAWDEALGEPRGWFAFLMMTGALLGAVSLAAIVLEGLGSLLLPACSRSGP